MSSRPSGGGGQHHRGNSHNSNNTNSNNNNNRNNGTVNSGHVKPQAAQEGEERAACNYHKAGTCFFGSNCRFYVCSFMRFWSLWFRACFSVFLNAFFFFFFFFFVGVVYFFFRRRLSHFQNIKYFISDSCWRIQQRHICGCISVIDVNHVDIDNSSSISSSSNNNNNSVNNSD
jgi:hypothetical protein